MNKTTEKIKAISQHVKNSKGLIITIISVIIIVIIVIVIQVKRNRDYHRIRPVFCTSPTSCKTVETFSPQFIKPLGSIYQFTFHFFIYINSYSYQYGVLKEVFSKGESDYACPAFWLAPKVNDGIFNIMTGNGMKTFTIKNIDIKRWCHIAICVKDGEADIYYRGKLAYTGILGDFCKINEDVLYIGRDGGFDGLIYKLSYNPKFLSPREVAKLASETPPTNNKYFS